MYCSREYLNTSSPREVLQYIALSGLLLLLQTVSRYGAVGLRGNYSNFITWLKPFLEGLRITVLQVAVTDRTGAQTLGKGGDTGSACLL